MGSRPLAFAGAVALACFLVALPGAAADEEDARPTIYKWVDQNGIAHYTTDRDRIPKDLRNRIGKGRTNAGSPAAALAPPAPAPTPGLAPPAPVPASTPAPPPAESAVAQPAPVPAPTSATPPVAAPAPAPTVAVAPPGPALAPPTPPPPSSPEAWASAERGAAVLPAVSAPPPDGTKSDPAVQAGLDARILTLEAEIARDEAALTGLLSDPSADMTASIADDPALREITQRLPRLIAALRALRDERGQLEER